MYSRLRVGLAKGLKRGFTVFRKSIEDMEGGAKRKDLCIDVGEHVSHPRTSHQSPRRSMHSNRESDRNWRKRSMVSSLQDAAFGFGVA